MPSVGINFRSSAGHVTDGPDQTYCRGGTLDQYPTVRAGYTFGWGASISGGDRGDGTLDPRISGMNRKSNSGTFGNFTMLLPNGPGTYDVNAILGDLGVTTYDYRYEIFDDLDGTGTTLTSLLVLEDDTGTATTEIYDFTRSTTFPDLATWEANSVPQQLTFSGTHIRIRFGTTTAQTGNTTIQHLHLAWEDAPTGDLYEQSVAGSITPTGAVTGEIVEAALKTKSVAGSITPTGNISEFGFGTNAIGGSITPVGTLATQQSATTKSQSISGEITPFGDVAIRISGLHLGGSITPVGTLATDPVQIFMQTVGGAITPTGNVVTLYDPAPTFGSADTRVIRRGRRIIIDGA